MKIQKFTSSLKVLYMQTNHRERRLLPEISWHDFTAAILQSSSEKLCVSVFFFFLVSSFSFFFHIPADVCMIGLLGSVFIAQAVSLVDNVVCIAFYCSSYAFCNAHAFFPTFIFIYFFPTGCFFFCVLLALLFMAYLVYWQNAKRQLNKTAEKLPLHQQRALLRRTAEWSLKHVNTRNIRQQIHTLYLSAYKKMFKD